MQHFSLRSFSERVFATIRQLITLLNKHRNLSLKILCLGLGESFNFFGGRKQKTSLLSNCFNYFPTKAKIFPFSLARKVSCVVNKSQRKPAKHKKTSRDKKSKTIFDYFLLKESFGSKKGTFCTPKKSCDFNKSLLFPSLALCLDMKQFDLVNVSVYNSNKSLDSQSVTKQELAKYQAA